MVIPGMSNDWRTMVFGLRLCCKPVRGSWLSARQSVVCSTRCRPILEEHQPKSWPGLALFSGHLFSCSPHAFIWSSSIMSVIGLIAANVPPILTYSALAVGVVFSIHILSQVVKWQIVIILVFSMLRLAFRLSQKIPIIHPLSSPGFLSSVMLCSLAREYSRFRFIKSMWVYW